MKRIMTAAVLALAATSPAIARMGAPGQEPDPPTEQECWAAFQERLVQCQANHPNNEIALQACVDGALLILENCLEDSEG